MNRHSATGKSPLEIIHSQPFAYDFEQLIAEYVAYQQINFAPKTAANSEHKLGKFCWWWGRYHSSKGTHPKFVTVQEAQAFVQYLKTPVKDRWGIGSDASYRSKNVLSPATAASYGRCIKAFFNWLVEERVIQSSPFNHKAVKFSGGKDENRVIKTLDTEQLRKVFLYLAQDISFLGRRNMAFMAFLLDTGVRRGEALNMTLGDLEIGTSARCVVRGKTGSREVYFSDQCRNILMRYLSDKHFEGLPSDSPVWISEAGEGVGYSAINRIISQILEHTGVRVSTHRMRHTFATMMIYAGSDIFTVQNLLGHADVATTQIYLHLNPEQLAATQKANSPLSSLSIGTRRRGRPPKR